MKLSELKSLTKEYGGPPISRKAYLKQKPMDPKLDEGRMKELHGYIERGMTAQQIAKKMKLDVKTIKALMPESVDEGLKDGYIVYKKMGISKIKKVATLKTMPKGKELDKVLDKYNADGVMAMSKALRNKVQVEAVTEAKGKYASDAQMDDFLKAMEKNPDVKKMSKHYNRPVEDIVKALRARVSVNRLRGGNVYTLNFTDKDSKLRVKAKKQYAPIKEAVDADDTGGEEEVSMAMKQVQAMRHFLDGIESRVKEQGDMEEWYQNKLTKANDYLKTLYSYGKGDKVQEAVSPAQQAAIAIAKKEKGEKPEIKESALVDLILAGIVGGGLLGGLAFVMGYTAYDVYQTDYRGRGLDKKLRQKFSDLKAKLKNKNYRPSKKDIETAKELGKEVKKKDPSAYKKAEVKVNKIKKDSKTKLKESRAYRDAMRGMKSRSATRGMATTKRDKDTEASDDDRKAASKNIIMQLRKAADLPTGAEVEFERGKGKVTRDQAQKALASFNALSKPNEKEKFQKSIRSLSDIKKMLGR